MYVCIMGLNLHIGLFVCLIHWDHNTFLCELKGSANNSNYTLPYLYLHTVNFSVSYFIALLTCRFCVSHICVSHICVSRICVSHICVLHICVLRISHKSVGNGRGPVADTSATWSVITATFGSLYKNWGSQPICGQWTQNL